MANEQTTLPTPRIGQGTWNMERDDRADAIAALRRGVELGLSHVDTAEMYGGGQVERLVGEAIGPIRDRVFLASKVLPSNASRHGTIEACEASLRRLGTDRIDLYMIHWPGPHPLEETFAAFEQLVEGGKIRRWGVSNFDADTVERAHQVAGPGKIACNQILYHLEERTIEHRVMPRCRQRGIPVVAYSPFGSGRFPSDSTLEAVAESHGVSPRQVALAFLLRTPGVYVIPKASQVRHVEDNAAALSLELSPEEITRLEQAFPLGPDRGLPLL